ncbi:alpha/beta hydrolase family protein [Prevotella sp.]|uniref:alpha/beta hydrolase family protein n=1 Tax=Prevotella sp. TaxID=59823 RepID=UPI002E79CA75|nr:S9 family peptidase [Prevotella sp.]MEE0671006.1 S9 family peptidase [Prevotella sp.]
MNKTLTLAVAAAIGCASVNAEAQTMIGKTTDVAAISKGDRMTAETLWAMGRIGGATASPDGKTIAYQVGYYSVKENKSHQMLYTVSADGKLHRTLTNTAASETDAAWINGGKRIAFLSKGQLWTMNADGSDRRQLTKSDIDIEGFKFSPDEKKVLLIKSLPYHESIKKNPDDLPLATGRVVTDLNYRHWDHYVETVAHPFVANVTENGVDNGKDIIEGEPYECPMAPFGGVEQLAWSPDSKTIAYTCRKKTGVNYAISTDSDIFLYDVATGSTKNLCKPEGYKAPEVDPTTSMKNQAVNNQEGDVNVGYDTNPQFSPDGKYVAWQSMKHDGYESDRNRLCVYTLATGEKKYVAEKFDSNVDAFCWAADSKTLYFIGCWHACVNMYQTNINGEVKQLTDDWMDFGSIQMLGNTGKILASRHSISQADELYIVTPGKDVKKTKVQQVTWENKAFYDQLEMGKVQERWVKTTDGKQMLVWVILPPHFDENKKYPTLLFCEGGPQSPVSQFWSYRWNFQIMAAHDYIVIAPNRRGLPGFGSEWNESISGDWTGQCMDDYLSAIDDATNNLPYVDKDRLGCVGASFGGFSVYYLAGHHNKRFKAFIAHDGAFNLESMYTDTEEAWFSNWEYDDAYWKYVKTNRAKRTYSHSPHKFVDKWDTPILCIHGEKDYRINANQGFGAFNAARLRGIPAELLIYPDENHWVLKPQNGVLWQRTFFGWLDKWLK